MVTILQPETAYFHDETLWLTQIKMAELFGVQKVAISKHLKNIFESGELSEPAVVSILETTASNCAFIRKSSISASFFLLSASNSDKMMQILLI